MKKLLLILLPIISGFFLFPGLSLAGRGCCSWHGGQAYCGSNGMRQCNDGTQSPTCTCGGGSSYTTPTYVAPTKTQTELCQDSFGPNSYYNYTSLKCECSAGYTSNLNGNYCETPTQSCQESFGSNVYSDGTVNTEGVYNCYCNAGYEWALSRTYCEVSYSSELKSAYDYAYSIGITTQPSIQTANMYGQLTRAEMAKMIVNYASEVLGKTPDTSVVCNFTDIAYQTTEMKGYIIESCQMGLMGVGTTLFKPKASVTRAEFGTTLSRALYGDLYNGGTPYYYTAHLAALKNAGIVSDIDTPYTPEIRGYVMIMMQRAGQGN